MEVSLNKLLVSSCIFLMFSNPGNTNQISFFVSGGPNFSTLENNRLVEINEVITNAYHTKTQTSARGFWAIGASHTFENSTVPSYQLSLGLAGYFFQLGPVKGIEYPFINAGLFDTLHYDFRAKSNSLMVEAKALYTRYAIKPYALVGIGPSWNKLSAYHEKPSDPSLSASPALPFSDHTKQTFSYELGTGLQYLLWDDQRRHIQYHASAGYQYFNLDRGALGRSLAQTSSDRIKVKNLYTQGIIFTLAASLG
ncbi:hypothetical protein J2N86_15305 (plasmid) [Legionella lytica]|uniref:Outer membrane protein beta-barrel domain-containing protein n=1 Tax=Legionella lytica TaxID=96232 RepID=A0ABY4YCI6_9GAMM|nr:hypothetical protein [Legionella lytica]USQ15326.1 hypothetical protein J2N86_15305 [Legionella lytica]